MVDFIIFGIFLIVFLIIISYGHDLNEDIWCCFDPCSQPYLMEKRLFLLLYKYAKDIWTSE